MNRAIYLPEGSTSHTWGVTVTAIGRGRVLPGQSYPLGGHPKDHDLTWDRGRVIQAMQVVYIVDGEGIFEMEKSGTKLISSGTVFFLFPGLWHRYRPTPSTGWTEDWIELRGPAIEKLMSRGVSDKNDPIFPVGHRPEFLDTFRRALELAQQKPSGFEAIIATLGLQIVALAQSFKRRSQEVQNITRAISRAQTLIADQIQLPLQTRSLAMEVCISESYFRRAFKARTGLTPKQYHGELRLRRVQDLLANTSLSIKEIASQMGFDSAFHLSAHYKAKTGKSPKLWRLAQAKKRNAAP